MENEKYIKIGNVKIKKTAALAPMAGVADRAFREICKKFGASFVVGELTSSMGLLMSDKKTSELLTVDEFCRPMAVQLFGSNPMVMEKACEKCLTFNPDIIDINMGCPAPKVTKNNSGSALMKDLNLASEIIKSVCKISTKPVTVKFRSGWDESNINAIDFAKMAEQSGASAITIHSRTRNQMYSGKADIEIIKLVKQAVDIPVIGNGDILTALDAKKMYDYTKCDLVMVGRGSEGNPWIFSEIEEFLKTGIIPERPTLEEKMEILKEHVSLLCSYKGELIGMKESRKHASWYIKNIKNAAKFREMSSSLKELNDIEKFCQIVLENSIQ